MAGRLKQNDATSTAAFKHVVRGEVGKLALTVAMFSSVFYWIKPLEVGYFFAALAMGLCLNIALPVIENIRDNNRMSTVDENRQ